MRINRLLLKNFKRFTELTIENIPESAKLVMVIGSNGSGKTGIFDAFNWVANTIKTNSGYEKSYFQKRTGDSPQVMVSFVGGGSLIRPIIIHKESKMYDNIFIGRSSLRIVPRIQNIQNFDDVISQDLDAPAHYIDNDNRFHADVHKYTSDINKALREPVFKGQSADTVKIFQEHIVPLNTALKNIFPQSEDTAIQLVQFEDALPGQPIKLLFKKGGSLINYDLLSHGEKQVVIILLNLLVRKEQIKDSIYFIDEMDAHLNTALQFNLLKEITENWIPDDAQLWTASHSLGFIDYARQAEHAVILDLDDLNFDLPQTIVPEPKDRMEVYEIAVSKDMLGRLFKDRNIVFVENEDAKLFNNLALPGTIFVPELNKAAVYHKVRTSEFKGIVDRDFLTNEEIAAIEADYVNLKILRYYSIENYLYHPDNMAEHHAEKGLPFDKQVYQDAITQAKNLVTGYIILGLVTSRMSYPFFGEHERANDVRKRWFKNAGENHQHAQTVQELLSSDDFETFYQVFPMKNQATQLPQRQNIAPPELTKTAWFKAKIQTLLTPVQNTPA